MEEGKENQQPDLPIKTSSEDSEQLNIDTELQQKLDLNSESVEGNSEKATEQIAEAQRENVSEERGEDENQNQIQSQEEPENKPEDVVPTQIQAEEEKQNAQQEEQSTNQDIDVQPNQNDDELSTNQDSDGAQLIQEENKEIKNEEQKERLQNQENAMQEQQEQQEKPEVIAKQSHMPQTDLKNAQGLDEEPGQENQPEIESLPQENILTITEVNAKEEYVILNGFLKVQVFLGDITNEQVDAITNAANEYLSHGAGVAEFGYDIQKESDDWVDKYGKVNTGQAAFTGSGRMKNVKYVIHAVGPIWRTGREEPMQLSNCIDSTLERAQQLRCESLSIPAISSGIFGFPKDLCARILFDRVEEFAKTHYDDNQNVDILAHDQQKA